MFNAMKMLNEYVKRSRLKDAKVTYDVERYFLWLDGEPIYSTTRVSSMIRHIDKVKRHGGFS